MRLKTKNLIYQLSYYYCSYDCWAVAVAKLVKLCFKIRTGKFSKQKWYCLFVKRTDFDDKLKNLNKKDYFKSNKTCICQKIFFFGSIWKLFSILKLFKTTSSILVALLRFIRGNLMKC